MTSKDDVFAPNWASPPGDTIVDLMEEKDWNQVELSNRLGISPKHLNQLIKGKVTLTYETALKLERVLGSTVSFWVSREAKYREHVTRLEAVDKYTAWSDWLNQLPLGDLKTIGVIAHKRITEAAKPQLVEQMLSFFGVASPSDWENHYASMRASFRKNRDDNASIGAIATWLRLGELVAEKMSTPKYNRTKFERAVMRIRELTVLPPVEFEPILRELCMEAGVKFVLVKSVKKAHVSGVARWLNGHSPLIQMSLYGKSNDKFWFTFFHEAAHILLHSEEKGAIYLDDLSFNQSSREEEEANSMAGNILIPDEYKYDLVSLRGNDEIIEFAKTLNIHPAIIVGRLQHEGQLRHGTRLNSLKINFEIS